jgi:hypothetical protein
MIKEKERKGKKNRKGKTLLITIIIHNEMSVGE